MVLLLLSTGGESQARESLSTWPHFNHNNFPSAGSKKPWILVWGLFLLGFASLMIIAGPLPYLCPHFLQGCVHQLNPYCITEDKILSSFFCRTIVVPLTVSLWHVLAISQAHCLNNQWWRASLYRKFTCRSVFLKARKRFLKLLAMVLIALAERRSNLSRSLGIKRLLMIYQKKLFYILKEPS